MARETWDIKQGFPIDCSCFGTGSTNNIQVNVDLSEIVIRLNTLIAQGVTANNALSSILSEFIDLNSPLTQTLTTTTVAGVIPAGVQSYSIVNLGVNPNDPNTTYNSMIIGGITLNNKHISFGNSTDSTKVLDNAVTYNPNGNTLLIVYNS